MRFNAANLRCWRAHEAWATSYDTFLSYSRNDFSMVESTAKWLKSQEISVWLDKWNLIPGEP